MNCIYITMNKDKILTVHLSRWVQVECWRTHLFEVDGVDRYTLTKTEEKPEEEQDC